MEFAQIVGAYQISNYIKGEVVEPLQTIYLRKFFPRLGRGVRNSIPLFDELFEVVLRVRFKLGDAFRTKGMGDHLSFSRVLCSITGIKKAALDGDEGIVIFTRFEVVI